MVSLPLCHIDGKGRKRNGMFPILPYISAHSFTFYTFRFALVTDVESRPPDDDMVGNKLPDGLRSFTGLRICGTSSVCCGDTFRTPSASGLTSCPSFSFRRLRA